MTMLGFAPVEIVLDETATEWEDEACHLFCCCSPNIALCGEDVTDEPIIEGDIEDGDCSRCVELRDEPCILCGFRASDAACACGACF